MVSPRRKMFRREAFDDTFEKIAARVNRLAACRDLHSDRCRDQIRNSIWVGSRAILPRRDTVVRENPDSRRLQALSRAKAMSQQQCNAEVVPPAPPLGAMALQSGLAMQAGRSYPQQLVQLVGHRHCGAISWVRPQTKI